MTDTFRHVIVEQYCPETLDELVPGDSGGLRFSDYLTFESRNSRSFEIKHGWSRGTRRSQPVHVLSVCVTRKAWLLPSPQWESALSEGRSSLVPIGLGTGCALITSTYGSQPQTQESVREPECKIDKIKVTHLHFETSPSLIWSPAQSWPDCDMNIHHGASCAKLYHKIYVMPVIQWTGPDNADSSFFISSFFFSKQCFWFSNVPSDLIYVSLLNWSHKSQSHALNDKQMLTFVQ